MKKILAGNAIQKQLQSFADALKSAVEKIQSECNEQDRKITGMELRIERIENELQRIDGIIIRKRT